jgi:RNA polymerase sigma-70 factor (ECF subfamily)
MQVRRKGDTIDAWRPFRTTSGSPAPPAPLLTAPHWCEPPGRATPTQWTPCVCGGPDDAEDVAQEALLKTYQHAGRIRRPDAFRSWLYRTVRNACLMHRRVHAGEPRHLLSLEAAGPGGQAPADELRDPARDPEDLAINNRLRERLRQAFASLPPAYREVMVLRDVNGLSTREAARSLGMSEDSVKTRLLRARRMLRRQLERP